MSVTFMYLAVLQDGQPSNTMRLSYTNWQGVTANRTIQAVALFFGATEYHPEPQWILRAWDVEKQAMRDFALKDMKPPIEEGAK